MAERGGALLLRRPVGAVPADAGDRLGLGPLAVARQWLGVFAQGRVDVGTAVLFRETTAPAGRAGPRPRLRVRRDRAGHRRRGAGRMVTGVDVNERAVLLANENAAALGVADRFTATTPPGVPADATYDELWSNPPIRIGKAALHELLLTWLPRLVPGGRAVLVVGKNLGADSLQRWLGEQGYPTERIASAKGFRVLETSARDHPWEDPDWWPGRGLGGRAAGRARPGADGEPEQPHVRTWATALRVPTARGAGVVQGEHAGAAPRGERGGAGLGPRPGPGAAAAGQRRRAGLDADGRRRRPAPRGFRRGAEPRSVARRARGCGRRGAGAGARGRRAGRRRRPRPAARTAWPMGTPSWCSASRWSRGSATRWGGSATWSTSWRRTPWRRRSSTTTSTTARCS